MSDATPSPPAAVCPMCGAALSAPGLECRQCGERAGKDNRPAPTRAPDLSLSTDFAPATIFDWSLAVLTTIVAVLFNLPTFMWLMDDVANQSSAGAALAVNLLWSGWLWGLPLALAWSKWHQAAYANLGNHTHAVRTFGRVQLVMILIPSSLLLLLSLICVANF